MAGPTTGIIGATALTTGLATALPTPKILLKACLNFWLPLTLLPFSYCFIYSCKVGSNLLKFFLPLPPATIYSLINDLASTKVLGFVRENLVGLLTTFPFLTSNIVLGFPNSFAFWLIILLRDLIYLESPVLL